MAYGLGQGAKRGYAEASRIPNSIMWKFMSEDKKAAIDQMEKILKEKAPDLATDKNQVKDLMEKMEGAYRAMHDPKDIADTFGKKGKLHAFLADNLSKMEDARVREVLTGNGLLIRKEDVFGMTRQQFDDVESLSAKATASIPKNDAEAFEQVAARKALNQSLKDVISYSEFFPHPTFMQLSREKARANKPLFDQLKNQVTASIAEISSMDSTVTPQARTESVNRLENAVVELQKSFSIQERKHYVTLIDTASTHEFRIALDEFDSVEDMKGKDLGDLIAAGRVNVKE